MAAETNPTQIQIQTNQIFLEKEYCSGHCHHSAHVLGLIFCMVVWGLLIPTIYLFVTDHASGDRTTTAILLSVAYFFYLIEAFCAKTWRYLVTIKVPPPGEDIAMYIARIKGETPIISMTCQCYHYETRTRLVTEYYTEYVNGRSVTRTRTRTEMYQELVITYTDREIFHYSDWSDDSGFLTDEIFNYNVVRIDLYKSWVAGNPETEATFHHQYNEFVRKNKHRDTYFSSSHNMDINGYEPNILWMLEKNRCMKWYIYAVITIICLGSVFYRYWLDRHSVHAKFLFKKIVKV